MWFMHLEKLHSFLFVYETLTERWNWVNNVHGPFFTYLQYFFARAWFICLYEHFLSEFCLAGCSKPSHFHAPSFFDLWSRRWGGTYHLILNWSFLHMHSADQFRRGSELKGFSYSQWNHSNIKRCKFKCIPCTFPWFIGLAWSAMHCINKER